MKAKICCLTLMGSAELFLWLTHLAQSLNVSKCEVARRAFAEFARKNGHTAPPKS